jgi:hypothetical protein
VESSVREKKGPSRSELLVRAAERNGIPRRMADGMGEAPPQPAEDPTEPMQVLPVAAGLLQATAFRAFADAKADTVIRAVDVWTRVTGGRAPERQHVTTETDQRAQYEAMAGPQRIAFLRENIAELQTLLDAEEKAQGIVTGVTEYVLAGKESEGR